MSAQSLKILLVEDNAGDARLLREMFREPPRDFSFTVAGTLSDGLRLMGTEEFAAVLLDLHLPDSQGLRTVPHVQATNPGIPIVVLTSVDDEAMAAKALEKGAQDYLVKGQVERGEVRRAILHAIQRKRMEVALKNSEERYRRIVETATEGIWIFDAKGHTTFVNRRLAEMLDYAPNEVTTLPLGSMVMCVNEEQATLLRDLRAGVRPFECRMKRKDGAELWALLSSTPIPTTTDDRDETLVLVTDITDIKKAELLKDEFIGMVSHELKTPLTVIMGSLYTSNFAGVSEQERRELVDEATRGGEALVSIIDNLLELSRSQANRLTLQIAALDVGDVAKGVVRRVQPRAQMHTLVLSIPAGLPHVAADKVRVERILDNLVDNAVKYSPEGGRVTIFAQAETDHVTVGVRDEGIGIATEDIPRLFARFLRLENATGSIKGIGLGLNVCRILAEAHGGRIWVESNPGQGSTFFFTLPVAK